MANICTYLVDNCRLLSQTDGIILRCSKDLTDFDEERLAEWGSTVRGCDEGDGWLRVGGHFLPTTIRGHQVLTFVEQCQAVDGELDGALAETSPPAAKGYEIESCYEALDLISNSGEHLRGAESVCLGRQAEVFELDAWDSDAEEDSDDPDQDWDSAFDSPSLLLQYEWFCMDKVSVAAETDVTKDRSCGGCAPTSPAPAGDDESTNAPLTPVSERDQSVGLRDMRLGHRY